MFSIFTYLTSRVTYSGPGLPVVMAGDVFADGVTTRDATQFCLNEDLTNVFNWLQANKLTINMIKTEFMLILNRVEAETKYSHSFTND